MPCPGKPSLRSAPGPQQHPAVSPRCLAFSGSSLMLFLLLSWFQILDINVKATALMTKAVVPEMEKRGYRQGEGAWVQWTSCGLRARVPTEKRVTLFFFQRRLSGDCGLRRSLLSVSCKIPLLCHFYPPPRRIVHFFHSPGHPNKCMPPFGITPPSPFPQNRCIASKTPNLGVVHPQDSFLAPLEMPYYLLPYPKMNWKQRH